MERFASFLCVSICIYICVYRILGNFQGTNLLGLVILEILTTKFLRIAIDREWSLARILILIVAGKNSIPPMFPNLATYS